MLKKILFVGICLTHSYLLCSDELKKAIEGLDVDATVSLLESKKCSEPQIVSALIELSSHIRNHRTASNDKESLGFITGLLGGMVGAMAALEFSRRRDLGEVGCFTLFLGSLLGGPLVGSFLGNFLVKPFHYKKARIILFHLSRYVPENEIKRLRVFGLLETWEESQVIVNAHSSTIINKQ